MCDVWQFSDVVLCTSSIIHMSSISLDRYTAIRDPLGSRGRSPVTFWLKIGAVWLASVTIGSPLIVLGVLNPGDLLSDDGQCAIVNAYFLIYGSLAAFFGPLIIMLATFVLTVRLLETEATQLAADGEMRRCTAERKAYPTPAAAIVTAKPRGSSADSAGRRRRTTRSSWMSRISRSEAPTTTSMLPSPSKLGHEMTLLPTNTISGSDVGGDDVTFPVDGNKSCEKDAVKEVVAAENSRKAATSVTGARRDESGLTGTGSHVDDISASAHAPRLTVSSTSDSAENTDSVATADSTRPKASSIRDVTAVTSSDQQPIVDERPTDERPSFMVKSVSEFSDLRRPELVNGRRSVAAMSLDSSSKMADRLKRRVMASLHPGNSNSSERCCLLKHCDDARRYVGADNDNVVKLLPETRVSDVGLPAEATVMRRSRSESAVAIQRPPTGCHSNLLQSRDQPDPVDPAGNDVIADPHQPLADTASNKAAAIGRDLTGDVIVADAGEEHATGNLSFDAKCEFCLHHTRLEQRRPRQNNMWSLFICIMNDHWLLFTSEFV